MSAPRPTGMPLDGTGPYGMDPDGTDADLIVSERFMWPAAPVVDNHRKPRTRAAIVSACRGFMLAGWFQPSLPACCEQAKRSTRAAYCAFGTIEALRLEAADDPSTRDAIVERVLGCERTALSPDACDRLVRALVTGTG
jgi:hypothetical protein